MTRLTVRQGPDMHWYLHHDDTALRCAIGKNGISAEKKEGDGKSPAGCYKLLYGFYRADRIDRPPGNIPFTAIDKHMGWCDDPAHAAYNSLVSLPFSHSHETLWREDHLYDLILVIDHNLSPAVPGKGSAVFLHIAKESYQGTEGCIALSLDDWFSLLPHLEVQDQIFIS